MLATCSACSQQQEISRYEEPSEDATDGIRDLAAALPQAPFWPSRSTTQLAYDTPDGWLQGQVSGMRKAAFRVEDGERKVEVTVIDLAAQAGALLPNVNRWRQQIQLGEISQEDLLKSTTALQVAGKQAHYVEILGPEDQKPRQAILAVVAIREGKAWFLKLWGDAELALQEKQRFQDFAASLRFEPIAQSGANTHPPMGPPTGSAPVASPLAYDVPDGWTAGKVGGMRKAAFTIKDGEQTAEITAIDLAAGAGGLLPNVNRWRKQVQLDEITQEVLDQTLRPIEVMGTEGHYVELVGPEGGERRLAILGVVAQLQDRAWFFKLSGDADLALREKERFENFVKSAKLAAPDGTGHD
ncbi:MAG: hypothetical protein ACC645_05730 [Pirellulales bacterium]